MSQSGIARISDAILPPDVPTSFVTNFGTAVPVGNTLNIVGGNNIETFGVGSTVTIDVSGTTNNAVQIGNSSGSLTSLAIGTNGQVFIGATGAAPAFATLTSTDGSITFTTGPNSLNLAATNTGTLKTLTGNSGGAISPTAGNINTVGTGSITIVGSGSTLTTELTGLTANAVLYGLGTATIGLVASGTTGQVLQTNTAAAPTWSTATYPSTTTINQVLYSSSANVVGGITASNNGVLISGTTGIPSWLAAGTTGQVLTATTGSPATWASPATSGTVTSVSVATANGFAGTVATATTTPAITLTTTQTGVLSGNGTAITGTAITQYNVITAGASNIVNSVAPTATSGVPLISQGAAAQPIFGTAVVAGGGTGNTTFTAYSVICAGTTATGIFQNVSGVGTSGQVLTSNGASALPTWQAGASVLTITTVAHAASPYTVLAADQFLAVDVTAGVVTIKLANAPTTGRVVYIKDSKGLAATSNISVTTVGGTVTIDGQTTYTMVSNYTAISVVFDGTNYQVF